MATKKVSKKSVKKIVKKVVKPLFLTVTGKRKTAIAKATIKLGHGKIKINNKPLNTFRYLRRIYMTEPLKIAETLMKDKINTIDININVKGGGLESQTEASRLAIAKALVQFTDSKDLKIAFTQYDRSMIIADVRRKEMRKPGDSKARKNRQTSYR